MIRGVTKEMESNSNRMTDHLWFGPDGQTPSIMMYDLFLHCIKQDKTHKTTNDNIKQSVPDVVCRLPTSLSKKKFFISHI